MAKREKPISDDLLISNGVYRLDKHLPLSARQVALITDLSVDQLKERRRTRPPKPPLALKRENEDAESNAVWYPLGEVLAYRASRAARDVPDIVMQRGIKTFAEFIAHGGPADQWPFTQTREGLLIDFFAALRMGEWIDPEGECGWMTKGAYLTAVGDWSQTQRGRAERNGFEAELGKAVELPRCPKCGRVLDENHQGCRL